MGRRARTLPAGDALVAVGYVRVSTDDQALGADAQRAAVRAWARAGGVEVRAWAEDVGVSGAAPLEARAGLLRALALVREHRAGLVLVARRDRIARDVGAARVVEREAQRLGARVVSADGVASGDAPADQFMRTVLDGAAEYERGLIRARTKAALGVKRARGELVGGVPFGTRVVDGGRLAPCAAELAVLSRLVELRRAGLTVRAVQRVAEESGTVNPRTGRPFSRSRVWELLRLAVANGARSR